MGSIGRKWGWAAAALAMACAPAWAQSSAQEDGPAAEAQRQQAKAGRQGAKAEGKEESPLSDLEKERFEQSAYGSKVSALAIAAEDSAWEAWSRKWAKRKDGRIPGVAEARIASAGAKIEMAVVLTTSGETFQAQAPLDYVVSIYRPDGSLQQTMPASGCMAKGATLRTGYMGLCDNVLDFELEPSDPKGRWVFKVRMEVPGQGPLVFGTSFESY